MTYTTTAIFRTIKSIVTVNDRCYIYNYFIEEFVEEINIIQMLINDNKMKNKKNTTLSE